MSERTGAVISEQTFGETVADAYGVPFCLAADGKWYRADASDPLLSRGDMALCVEPSVAAGGIGALLKYGWIRRTGWAWILGQPVYFGATPGTLTQTKPVGNTIRYAGYPAAADALWFSPTDPVLAEYLSLDLPAGTRGDLLAHNGVAWAPLAPGTEGQVLQTGGPGADPAWADLPDGLYRNAIINGNFDIWQRGTSFTDSNVQKYTADRWRIYTSGDARLDVRRSTDVPENVGMYYSMEIELTNSNGGVLVGQIIENFPTLFKNKAVNLSFWVKKVSGDISTFIPMQSDTRFDPVILSTSWQRYSSTITMGSSPPLETRIFRAPDTTGIVRITGVQLNIGDKPLPFAPRPIAEELALCQRYCRVIDTTGINYERISNGQAVSATSARLIKDLGAPMRVAPTVTPLTAANTFALYSAGSIIPVTAGPVNTGSAPNVLSLQVDVASGLTAGNALFLTANGTAIAKILLDAEF